jgi:hypothetical protein
MMAVLKDQSVMTAHRISFFFSQIYVSSLHSSLLSRRIFTIVNRMSTGASHERQHLIRLLDAENQSQYNPQTMDPRVSEKVFPDTIRYVMRSP